MQVFRKLPRTFFNALCVRGKRRTPRVILFLCLAVLTYTVCKQALCMLSPSSCETQLVVLQAGHVDLQGPVENVRNEPPLHLSNRRLPNSLAGTTAIAQPDPADQEENSQPQSPQEAGQEESNYDHVATEGNQDEPEREQPEQEDVEAPQVDVPQENGQPEAVEGEEKVPQEPDAGDKVPQKEEGANAKQDGEVHVATTEHAQNNTMTGNKTATESDYEEEEESDDIGEDGDRMSPEEVAEAIKTGAMCKTVCPPFRWSKWSPCSKACGRGRKYRKAIYDFVCPTSKFCPMNRVEEGVCDIPCRFDPDKYGGPDGLDLYPVNPLNPVIYLDKYGCGNWLVEYQKLHHDIVVGKRPPNFLIYSTGKGDYPTAGGISGRIKGITTVFFMAVLLERAFLIEWDDPPGLGDYLEPKSFDWADLTPIHGRKHGPIRDIASWKAAKDDGHSSQWYMNTNFSRYFKYPVERIQGARYDFTYALLRNPELMPKAYEYGIDRIKCRLCCAWDFLFKMSSKFEEEMKKIYISINYPAKPLLALQVRAKSDNIEEAVKVAEHNVNCGQKASSDLKITPVYVPVFNNRLVVHIVAKKYRKYIKTPIEIETATRTVHTHLGNLPSDTEVAVAKGVQERTFKEFFLMLNSTVLIRTKGYLGSMANVADAIRRHYAMQDKNIKVHTYTAGGSSCSLIEDGTKIE